MDRCIFLTKGLGDNFTTSLLTEKPRMTSSSLKRFVPERSVTGMGNAMIKKFHSFPNNLINWKFFKNEQAENVEI